MTDHLPVPAEHEIEDATAHPALHQMRGTLTAAADAIRSGLLEADDAIREAIALRDVEQLAYLLRGVRLLRTVLLRPLIDDLAVLDRSAEDAVVGLMESSRVQTDVGLLQRRKSGGSTTWSGRDLLLYLTRSFVDPDTGERVDAIPVEVLLDVLPQATAPSAPWRTTGLRAHDIDPDEWKFTIGDRYTVTIVEEGVA
jgi:hypothetical protein